MNAHQERRRGNRQVVAGIVGWMVAGLIDRWLFGIPALLLATAAVWVLLEGAWHLGRGSVLAAGPFSRKLPPSPTGYLVMSPDVARNVAVTTESLPDLGPDGPAPYVGDSSDPDTLEPWDEWLAGWRRGER